MSEACASQRGRSSRAKGARYERELAGWFRGHGWPHAERGRNNGFRTADREAADGYDITGVPGWIIDAKCYGADTTAKVPGWLRKASEAAGLQGFAMVVVKRNGHADPGDSWAYVSTGVLVMLVRGKVHRGVPAGPPVCLPLDQLARIMRTAGFGDPMTEDEIAAVYGRGAS